MPRQKHDIGFLKRLKSKPPMEKEELMLWRAKRLHPGPLPSREKDKNGEEESSGHYAKRILTDARRKASLQARG